MIKLRKHKGALSLEYALLISVLALALVSMTGYLGRAISGRWRDIGDSFGFGRQYDDGGGVSIPTFTMPNINITFPSNQGGWGFF